MNKNYLLPWKQHIDKNGKVSFRRISLTDDPNKDSLGFNLWQTDSFWVSHLINKRFKLLEDAMKAMDEYLIKSKVGWTLIPEGKENVYKCLM